MTSDAMPDAMLVDTESLVPQMQIGMAAQIQMEMGGLMMATGHLMTLNNGKIVMEMAMAMNITLKWSIHSSTLTNVVTLFQTTLLNGMILIAMVGATITMTNHGTNIIFHNRFMFLINYGT